MLVFISDLHLTDLEDDKDREIKVKALREFSKYLISRAKEANAEEIEVVLLGDIFDVIRSDKWNNTILRPWSKENDKDDDKDRKKITLKDYTIKIVKDICTQNKKFKQFLNKIKAIKDREIKVKFTYIIGNHDRLINRYPETRKKIAEFIGLNSAQYKNKKFDQEYRRSDCKVLVRHGDIYDTFNFKGEDEPSLGDAIVIDLLNKFLSTLKGEGNGISKEVIKRLKEIHNVGRPVDIPFWISWVCESEESNVDKQRVKKVWDKVVKEFLKIDFVENCNSLCESGLKQVLEGSRHLPLPFTEFRLNLKGGDYKLDLRLPLPCVVDYNKHASKEDDGAEFVLYGHTHNHAIEFLGQKNKKNRIYINTGAWRKVYTKAAYDWKKFIGWYDMVAVTLYTEKESRKLNKGRYEIWHMLHG